jgi:hypothetical protein
MKLGDYLNAINYTKEPLLDTEDESVEKGYTPFVVNRCLSYFIDTILYANEMNLRPETDKKMQFDYLQRTIRKNKRYSKWLKQARRNTIVHLLDDGNLLDIVDKDCCQEPRASLGQIKIISHRDKGDWELVPKYHIGN